MSKKKTFLWLIFINLLGHVLWRPLNYAPSLHQMKGLIKVHHLVKFLEDSSFGSNFRDL